MDFTDASVTALDVLTQLNTNELLIHDTSIGALQTQVDFTDASVTALDVLTQFHIAELLVHDASIGVNQAELLIHDTSIGVHTTQITNLDSSFGLYETRINLDSSFGNIKLGDLSDVSIIGTIDGSSLVYESDGSYWTYGVSSSGGGGEGVTFTYVDGSIAAAIAGPDASIVFTDASVTALDVLTQFHIAELLIHDASIGALQSPSVGSGTIYITSGGNDSTGDGSSGSPYLTIDRALADIYRKIINGDIVIDIGSGTFDLTTSTMEMLSNLQGIGSLTILGDENSVRTITYNSHNGSNNCQVDLDDTGMSVDAYKQMWAYDSTFVDGDTAPIFENGATFIIAPNRSTWNPTHIIDTNTILEIPDSIDNFEISNLSGVSLKFKLVEIYANTQARVTFNGQIDCLAVRFKILKNETWSGTVQPTLKCGINFIGLLSAIICDTMMEVHAVKPGLLVYPLLDYQYSSVPSVSGWGLKVYGNIKAYGVIINGYNKAVQIMNGGSLSTDISNAFWMIDDCETAFVFESGAQLYTKSTQKIYFDTSLGYILGLANADDVDIFVKIHEGVQQGDYSNIAKKDGTFPYVSPSKRISIEIPEVFPEILNDQTANLPYNDITYIIVGSTSEDRAVYFRYIVMRDTSIQEGRGSLVWKGGSSYQIFSDYQGDDVGISVFDGDISGTDIRLKITMDNSDTNDTTFNYSQEIIKL